jgi:superfamily II DNA or RNA helicase
MIILFRKSQLALFDAPVHVAASVRKDGTVVKPHIRIQKVAMKPAVAKPVQLSIFDQPQAAAKPIVLKPRTIDLFAHDDLPTLRDDSAEKLEALSKRVGRYASGMSRARDFTAASFAGHPVGVDVGQLSGPAMQALADAVVNRHTPVFVDSGAYSLFRAREKRLAAGEEVEPLDFQQVLDRYDQFTDLIGEKNEAEEALPKPILVMPDVMGDQAGSLAELKKHAKWINVECSFDVARPLVPIPKGDMSLTAYYDAAVAAIGTDRFIVGIPAVSGAWTPEQVTAFLKERKPRAVHFLGALHDSRLTKWLQATVAAGVSDEIEVTADACPLKSAIVPRDGSKQTGEERAAKIVDKLGVRARAEELDNVIAHYGGAEGVRNMLAEADFEQQQRFIGLISDLSGKPQAEVRTEYGLGDGPVEGDTKTEDGVEYVLRNGRWHRASQDEATAPAPAAEAGPWLPGSERLVLMACGKKKKDGTHPASQLYTGALGGVLNKWAPKGDARPDIAIVSAKHGLVHGDTPIESYDQQMTPARSKELATAPADLAPFKGRVYKDVFIAGGSDYRRVADEYVKQLRAAGIIAPDAEVHSTSGEIGEIKSQFGQYLRSITPPAGAAVAPAAVSAPAPEVAPPAPGTPFGVAAGTSKGRRREINAAVIAALEAERPDPALLRQYSGNGGCGDSLNEFYTDPDVARSMWTALARLGAEHGTALEPSCATGVFLHTAPAGFRVTGVELDPVSAKVAHVLHGARHEIMTASFERFATMDDRQFDVVIGNPPYGPRGKLAKDDKKYMSTCEQYFTDTALDKCKPGGLVALVVPTGIVDGKNTRALRADILRKGEFLGAMRMPNTAFEHSHTEVTTDVIFLRKRPDDVAGALGPLDDEQRRALGVWDEEFLAGSYFTGRGAHNVLGTMTEGWRAKAGMGNDITVEGSMVGVADAIAGFQPDSVGVAAAGLTVQQILDSLPDDHARERSLNGAARRPYQNTAKVGDTKTVDGVTYVLQGEPPRWHRVDEFMAGPAISEAAPLAARIEAAMEGGDREGLAEAVRAYVEKYGIPADNPELMTAASVDKTLYRLVGAVNRKGELSDVVLGRGARKVEGGFDTTAQVLALTGGEFTAAQLAERLDRPADEVEEQLAADTKYAYLGDGRWTTMDTYLTGELWPKLDAARAALAAGGDMGTKLEAQVASLEKAIDPKALDDVDFQLNSAFLPLDVVAAFFNWRNHDAPGSNDWTKKLPDVEITFAGGVYAVTGGNQYGDSKLLDKYLNRSGIRKEEDLPKVEALNAEFKEWLCGSPYRDQVEELYNRKFRGYVAPEYSDEPMDVPGLNPDRSVRNWRWSSLRRSLAQGKGIVADDVGLGKTLGGLLLARMARVQGSAQKPIIVVPKSVLANWYAESQAWFPGSRVLTIGADFQSKNGELVGKDDSAAERKRKYHDLTQNDYDFIIISEPAFEEIDLDPITKEQYYSEDFWVQRGEAMGNAGDKRRKAIRERYEQALAQREFADRTDAIYFNDLGIDMLIADEMHHQKNLYAARARFGESPKFLGGQGLSNRALDFNLKTRWVREQNGGKGVHGLTATPTKNSPLEIYSMLSHIAPEAFERIGVRNSEEFLDRFCEFQQDKVLSTAGEIEDALVVSGFKNLSELREIMARFIDRRTAAQVGLDLPERQDRLHLVDMSSDQQAIYAELRELAEESGGKKDATGDSHIFAIMDKMNKAALDLALLDPAKYAGRMSPKYKELAKQAAEGKKDGGQVIFSEYVDSHEKIVDALVEAGFDRKRIAIINAKVAGSAVKRQNIADAFNAGKLDAVIGNCTMAEGLNLQKTTTDIHNLDIPWEPATLQQRNGRGLRQGNLNEAVRIHSYLSKGSFDGYRYQAVAAKKDWQDLLWNGGDRVENLAREGAFSLDDMRIMLAADPESARAAFEADKAAALQRYEAGQRTEAVSEFVRFQDMKRSYGALKSKGSASATRLRDKIEAARASLFKNKYFPAKDALDSDTDVLIHPDTGTVLAAGTGMDFGANGKMVVTGVNMRAGTVTLRRYADTTGARHVTVPLREFGDAKPFAVDTDAEAGEVRAKMEEAAAASLNNLKGWDDVKNLPSSVLEANHDLIQRQIKEGAKSYKFHMPYGSVPMVNKETGELKMAESYEHTKLHDTHDYLLPTDAAKDKAIRAWMEARRNSTIGSEHITGKRGKSSSRAARKYKDTSYSNQHRNPVTPLLNELSGGTTHYGVSSPLVKEAKARLEAEQMDRIRHADNIRDAVRAILPLAKVSGSNDSYGDAGHIATYPKKALTMLWARARHLGALNHSMEDAAGVDHHAYAVGRHRKATVHNALVAMAIASGHRDLAEAMVESGIRHNKDNVHAETVRVLGHGYENSRRHLEQLLHHAEEAGVADMTLRQLGEYRLSGPFASVSGYHWGSDQRNGKTLRAVIAEQIEQASRKEAA